MPPPELPQLIADYADLEVEIDRLVRQRLSGVCAACTKPCCRPDVCQQAVESWWLRQVSEHVHGRWWPRDWETRHECIAMTPTGCLLTAGRPIICRSFVCDHYTRAYEGIWEAAFYSFVADLLWEVGQLSSRVHLEQVEEEDFPRYAGKLAERIAAARWQLDLARQLLDENVDEVAKHRILLKLLCLVPRSFRATTRRALLERLGDL